MLLSAAVLLLFWHRLPSSNSLLAMGFTVAAGHFAADFCLDEVVLAMGLVEPKPLAVQRVDREVHVEDAPLPSQSFEGSVAHQGTQAEHVGLPVFDGIGIGIADFFFWKLEQWFGEFGRHLIKHQSIL